MQPSRKARDVVIVPVISATSDQSLPVLTLEHIVNYVLSSFWEKVMFKTVIQEAAALASLSLFIGMIAIWSQVLGNL